MCPRREITSTNAMAAMSRQCDASPQCDVNTRNEPLAASVIRDISIVSGVPNADRISRLPGLTEHRPRINRLSPNRTVAFRPFHVNVNAGDP